jgi:hypothetical protein
MRFKTISFNLALAAASREQAGGQPQSHLLQVPGLTKALSQNLRLKKT